MPARLALAVLLCASSFLAPPVRAQESCADIRKTIAGIDQQIATLRSEGVDAEARRVGIPKFQQFRASYAAKLATCGQSTGAGGGPGPPGAQAPNVGESLGGAAKNIGDAIGRQGDDAIRALENLGKGSLSPGYKGIDPTLRDKAKFGRSDVNLDDLEAGAGGGRAGPLAAQPASARSPTAANTAPALPSACGVLQKPKTNTRDLLALCGPAGDATRCAAAKAQLDADRQQLIECVQKIQVPGAPTNASTTASTTTSARCEGPNAKNLANRYICVGQSGYCGGTLPCCTDECQDNDGANFNLHDDKSLYLACHPKTRRCVRASQLGVPAYAAPEMPNPSLVTFDLPKPKQNKPPPNAALDALDAVLNNPAGLVAGVQPMGGTHAPCAPPDATRVCPAKMPGLPPVDPGLASGARCRGACGVDCPSHCRREARATCVSAQDGCGKPAAVRCEYEVLSCGSHPGCIDHDAAYDVCADAANAASQDGRALAAKCTEVALAAALPECWCWRRADAACVAAHQLDCKAWKDGGGPQPVRLTFSEPLKSARVVSAEECR